MSTYLIAFVISDFDVRVKTTAGNVKLRVFSRPEQIQNTAFGLETAESALEHFESSFGAKYELEKLDQVALPVFNSGGMENYGIVFYREDFLLYEPTVSVYFQLKRENLDSLKAELDWLESDLTPLVDRVLLFCKAIML
jgi:aminopeptidase N